MYDITVDHVPQRMALVVKRRVTVQTAPRVIPEAFAEIFAHIDSGAACGPEERLAMFPLDFTAPGEHEIRIAVVIADGVPGPAIELDELPACKVIKTTHYGAYPTTPVGWTAVLEWMDERDLDPALDLWEVYLNTPDEVAESELATELLVPLP
jgi:effector-binding domain-containing protein